MSYISASRINFTFLKTITLSYGIQSLTWFNPRTIVVIDEHEHLHVLDTRSGDELEDVDVTDLKLLYQTMFFKSLATGSNVR